jgi:hypothetical protein
LLRLGLSCPINQNLALAYDKFDEDTRAGAHEEYLDSIADFRVGAGYEIPGEFVVASGIK